MAWDLLRRLLRLMGSKVMVTLAPRLLFFQYYDHLGMQLEEQKKKFRIVYQKSQAQLLIYELLTKKPQYKIGVASILDQDHRQNTDEAYIIQVSGDLSSDLDCVTVSSNYQADGLEDLQFVEMERSYVQDV